MVNSHKTRPLLSVLIPVYNEGDTLEEAIRRVVAVELPVGVEIICVDDASKDDSPAILEELRAQGLVAVVVRHPENRGKGAAVRTAIGAASGDILVIQDADLEYDPRDLPLLLKPILEGRADAVYGSRFLGAPHRVLYFWHRLGNGFLTFVSNLLTDLNLTDMETCYKMVRGDLLRSLPLESDRFGIEPEITARLAQAGARIFEVPVSYAGRTYGEGKKIGWRDGIAALWHLIRFNLFSRPGPPYDPPPTPPPSRPSRRQ
ncbi:MAG: glycosyltransferase family 2 protein [Gemmatimonadota bacterium]